DRLRGALPRLRRGRVHHRAGNLRRRRMDDLVAPVPRPLAGEVALVTGGGRIIGAATALRLASDGAAVAVHHHGPSSREDAAAIVARVGAGGGRAIAVAADIGREQDIAAMVGHVVEALGGPTILVNS